MNTWKYIWGSGRRMKRFYGAGLLAFFLAAGWGMAQKAPWVAPKDADNLVNPLKGNGSVLADAKKLYVANCGPCHGARGKGDGVASQGLNPRPADHTSAKVQGQTDGAIFWKMSEGRAPMPAYKKLFSEQQRWELVNYIRSLAK
ncbi:MAG TPA: c-type cytochrome [Chitinophagaceae bacterium]|nr:c-type cytochrome [Chitinophagaceae bacterium]